MMLDYGCGSGGFQEITSDRKHLGSWLSQNGSEEAVGIDINPNHIRLAKKKIRNGTCFVVADGKALPFTDNCFDVIHVFGVLHHMSQYLDGVKEMSRALKPGGRLLLTESVDNDPLFYVFRRILGRWQGDEICSLFDSETLDEQLNKYFCIEIRKYYWRFILSDFLRMIHREPNASLAFNNILNRVLAKVRLSKHMCCHYYVEARKCS